MQVRGGGKGRRGDARVLDTARSRRTAGGHSHEGEVTEQEEERGYVQEEQHLTLSAMELSVEAEELELRRIRARRAVTGVEGDEDEGVDFGYPVPIPSAGRSSTARRSFRRGWFVPESTETTASVTVASGGPGRSRVRVYAGKREQVEGKRCERGRAQVLLIVMGSRAAWASAGAVATASS